MINEANLVENLSSETNPQITLVQVTDLNSSLSLLDEDSLTYETTTEQLLNKNEFNFFHDSEITIFSKNQPASASFILKVEEEPPLGSSKIVSLANKQFFEAKIPVQASFELSVDDWEKLKQLQRGHRFKRGEWEDYFVTGMKESNKYCVFAFKDHYVNHSSIRKRRASMSRGGFCSDTVKLDGKKTFSANGYCVFSDCSVKFMLKMNSERQAHVFYEGQVKHAINEVNARYFRGKSRQELKETLKHTTPMREYLNRVQNSKNLGVFGNVDYVGKSSTVYRRISSEAKDQFQALLQLRNQFIQQSLDENDLNAKVLGYIQMIQHIPGAIVCFSQSQLNLFNYLFIQSNQSILYISSFRDASFVHTTMNSQKLYLYEMCLRLNETLLPLSSLITTNSNANCSIRQWITMFVRQCDSLDSNVTKFILCESSMTLIETLLSELANDSFESYSNRSFSNLVSSGSEFDSLNSELIDEFNLKNISRNTKKVVIHCCTNRIMIEISKLCRYYYYQTLGENNSVNNFNFGLYAFNVIVNSSSLLDLQRSIYSFMCILYSQTINSLVKKSFDYLKAKLDLIEASKNEHYLFDFNFRDAKQSSKETNSLDDLFGKSPGLSAFKRYDTEQLEKLNKLNESSVFYKMCEKLYEKCKQDIDLCEYNEAALNLSKNPRKSHHLLYHFVKQFSATLPLWSKLFVQSKLFPMTSAAHVDRFKSLLNEQDSRKDSVDLFIRKLHDDNEKLIDLYSRDLNRFVNFRKKQTKSSALDDLISSSESGSEDEQPDESDSSTCSVSSSPSIENKTTTDLIRLDTKRKRKSSDYSAKTNAEETEIIIERESLISDNLELNKSDLDSLDETSSSLNSKIIEFYLKMLQIKNNSNETNLKVLTFPIKFYSDLKMNQTSLGDETNNIFNFNLVLVPVKKGENLSLAAIDFRKRKITYYDSCLLNDFECLKILTDFIDKQYYLWKKDKYDFRNWKISNDKSTTLLSTNTNQIRDTGVYVLFLAKRLVNNLDLLSIKQNEIELFRLQIKQEIIHHLIT